MSVFKLAFWRSLEAVLLPRAPPRAHIEPIPVVPFKKAKYEIRKPSTCRAALFRCRFWVDASRFSPCRGDQLVAQQKFCWGLKKVVTKSRARVYFERQILALWIVFHQIRNLSWIHTKQTNQSVSCISSTHNNCFCWATS